MRLKIKVYSDYVCPYCFLVETPLEQATKGKDVDVEWMPFELRPYPNETLRPEESYLQTSWKYGVYPTAERMGIQIVLPRLSPQPYTHLAFEGYQFAKLYGKGNEYNTRILRAFFQEEQDIGTISVLTELAAEIGLERDAFREALEKRTFCKAHQAALRHAYYEMHISAVPTIVIGETVLSGLQTEEALKTIIDKELTNQQYTGPYDGMSCDINGCT